jgi:hypothetical protein
MLWTIFVILLVLWLLGVVTSYTLGGFIHVLLVVAVVLAIMQLLQGRRALSRGPAIRVGRCPGFFPGTGLSIFIACSRIGTTTLRWQRRSSRCS